MSTIITGCKKDVTTTNSNTTTVCTDESCEEEILYDFQGKEFLIMSNNPVTADPFSDQFEGLYQREKQENQQRVEEKYNIKVKYIPYPASASWGVPRDNYIINSEVTGQPGAHIYNLSASSIPVLASAGAIVPVGQYYEKYAHEQFLTHKKDFVKFKDEFYGYDDSYPFVDVGLYYNQDLLEEMGYAPNKPSQMWLDGEWTWENYESFVKEINTKLDETSGKYPMGGKVSDWADGMVPANGGYFLNDELEIGVDNPETITALENLAEIWGIPGMWISEVDSAYSTEENWKQGKVIFNPGAHWHLFEPSRMGSTNFKIGYVPYPKGPDVVAGNAEYKQITQIWGAATFVYSGSYQEVPAGYEHLVFSTEVIYRIHSELLYFGDLDDTFIDLSIDFLKYYADEESVDAHLDVLNKAQNEILYGLGEDAFGWQSDSCIQMIVSSIKDNNVRAQMTTLTQKMEGLIETMFGE
jgi:maltose-binding protein MalE